MRHARYSGEVFGRGTGRAIVGLLVVVLTCALIPAAEASSKLFSCKASQFAPPITQPPPITKDFKLKNDMFCSIGALPLIRAGHNGITIDLGHHLVDGNAQG